MSDTLSTKRCLGPLGLALAAALCFSESAAPPRASEKGAAVEGRSSAQTASLRAADIGLCADAAAPPTRGIYVVTPLDSPIPDELLGRTEIDGVAIRVSWKALQPTAQAPSFSIIDRQLAAARLHGKRASLSIEAGIETPDWVYTIGAQAYSFTWDDPARFCTLGRLPVPWDRIYLDAWKRLIELAGKRYNRNDILSHVKVGGLSGKDAELSLPRAKARTLTQGRITCQSTNELAAWLAAGYSRAKLEQAWQELITTYAAAFSSHRLGIVLGTSGFPPIDSLGRLMPGQEHDSGLAARLLYLAGTHRGVRFSLQSSASSRGEPEPLAVSLGDRGELGMKPLDGSESATEATLRQSTFIGTRYVELSISALQNPRLRSAITQTHLLLR